MDVCTSGKACAFFIIREKWQSMCALHHNSVILDLKLRGQEVGVHHKMVFSAYVIVGGKKKKAFPARTRILKLNS
jgi:hypothetical protein